MDKKIEYSYILILSIGLIQPSLSAKDPILRTALTSNVHQLALSVNNPQLNPALTGNIRTITLQNTGKETAQGLTLHYPNWPDGTTATHDCGEQLPPSGTCTISIKPGSIASSNCHTGTLAIPSTITVSANNALAIRVKVVVLSYGCVYEGGYLFSINDKYSKYPDNVSIGGKVVEASDEADSIAWDPSPGCTTESYDNCYKTLADSIKNGNYYFPGTSTVDPNGNTYRIVTQLPLDPSSYAAGVCRQSISGYSDWYLPSICELGYYMPNSSTDPGCGTNAEPSMQNMLSNLVDNGNLGNLWGMYWSSTENSNSPNLYAWFQYIASGGSSFQSGSAKASQMAVRCVRALTP
ncbi:MAG: DUF1566 domain-containing protein [Gammaproteobacteria bacterium]|nr:DUF1566 domain-containing protein [Gammaproteobacteria bacterium]